MLVTKKWRTTKEDFERRKENAISEIKNKLYELTPRKKVFITEQDLREKYLFEDIDKAFDKYDQIFFNGDFVLLIDENTVWV